MITTDNFQLIEETKQKRTYLMKGGIKFIETDFVDENNYVILYNQDGITNSVPFNCFDLNAAKKHLHSTIKDVDFIALVPGKC